MVEVGRRDPRCFHVWVMSGALLWMPTGPQGHAFHAVLGGAIPGIR